ARRVVDGAAPSRPRAPAPGRRGRAVGAGALARARVTMSGWVDTVLVLIALTSFVLLGSSRLGSCIRVVALQGVLLGYLTLTARGDESALRTGLLAAGSAGLKGIVFPWLLSRALREADVRREIEPLVGYSASLLIGALALGVSLWLSAHLPLPDA